MKKLPEETREYVPKVLAAAIVSHDARISASMNRIDPHTGGQTSLPTACATLNPSLRSSAASPREIRLGSPGPS